MSTILVWILVGFPYYGHNTATVIPPMADLASCERVKQSFERQTNLSALQCVQVAVPK